MQRRLDGDFLWGRDMKRSKTNARWCLDVQEKRLLCAWKGPERAPAALSNACRCHRFISAKAFLLRNWSVSPRREQRPRAVGCVEAGGKCTRVARKELT